ncbi:MAG: hypothetical protein KIS63_02410 [Caldilineales bacterium]|nr:hypothetical protein [Caldilineales bacterium]
MNAGGGSYTDGGGAVWPADQFYVAGGWGYTNATSAAKTSTKAVTGTVDDALYQAWREGPGEYRFTLPNGDYTVRMHFAEMQASAAGARVFRVRIEGSDVEPGLDVYAVAGRYTALVRSYPVRVAMRAQPCLWQSRRHL